MEGATDIRRRNLDGLLEIAAAGIFIADRALKIQSMNREAERLLGLEPGEWKGLSCREVLGPHMCSEDCAFRNTLEDGEARRDFLVRVAPKSGVTRDLVLSTAYLDSPVKGHQEVAIALRDATEAQRLRRALRDRWVFHGMVGASTKMKEIFSLVREMAPYDSTALILGESGTGKELVARAIHRESPRRAEPFVTVNCSAYSEGLLESELFGHVEGAFTGAVRSRKGRFESAAGGTVFLDEIGEIPPAIQVKLLRVLQEHNLERVGDSRTVPVDIRVVAATNRDLRREVREGRFREDLYYRLNVIAIELPPLRERRQDIPVLLDHFLKEISHQTGKDVDAFADEALETLFRHDWPGNVRELINVVEHSVIRTKSPVILPRDLPGELSAGRRRKPAKGEDLDPQIDAALKASGGRIGRAAELLGVHRTTLWRRLKRSGRVDAT